MTKEGEVEVWEEDGIEDDFQDPKDLELFDTVTSSSSFSLKLWFCTFLKILQKKFYLPDAAIQLLLTFLTIFFGVLKRLAPQLSPITDNFPPSLHKLEKLVGDQKESFVRYVVCGKCYEVYQYKDCKETSGVIESTKLCSKRNLNFGRLCKSQLLRFVELKKQVVLYPMKVYCYAKLRDHIHTLLSKPGHLDRCNHWKTTCTGIGSGMYRDIYDGKIWQEFQDYNGTPFLRSGFNFGLMLNIDWFKPCKHTEYSVGAIYLTVMNLPREVRFRQENVLLIGIIPGPKEPKRDIIAFLGPLVKELLDFWHGVEISIQSLQKSVSVRCALLCVACDIPASRKVCGFLGHSANLGCSKCLKRFPGGVGSKDYYGFDRTIWPERNVDDHRKNVEAIKECTTVTKQCELESKYGCRYSAILDLPYFDPVRIMIIDPMHNLFLGTAKHILKDVWLERNLITKSDLSSIQESINSMHVPRYVGRIPYKIASSFAGFTADQFKSWTNFFSLICLRNILPPPDLKCWRLFVIALRIICQPNITQSEIDLADALVHRFCCQVETLYGTHVITPNLHLHCHLRQSIKDYGPVNNFWLFAYERYNGILESYPTNGRSIEIQLMKKFLKEFTLYAHIPHLPSEFQDDFSNFFTSQLEPHVHLEGSLRMTVHSRFNDRHDPRTITAWQLASGTSDLHLPNSYVRSAFSASELLELKQIYTLLYPTWKHEDMELISSFQKYRSLTLKGTHINEVVFTRTPGDMMECRPVVINHFALHAVYNDNSNDPQQHVFVNVSWLKRHHANGRDHFVKPVEIWWRDLFDTEIEAFVPLQLVVCHSVCCEAKYEGQMINLIVPVQNIPNLL